MNYLAFIFGAVAILDLLAIADAHHFSYITVHREGLNLNGVPLPSLTRMIPSKQCTGELEYPRDFSCFNAYAPQLLEVEVQDDEGPPRVIFSADNKKVEIYRVACDSPALIIITFTCDAPTREVSVINRK